MVIRVVEIKSNYTIDEFAAANWESMKRFKLISMIFIIVGILGLIPSFIMYVMSSENVYLVLTGISSFLLIFFALLLFNITPKQFKKRLVKNNPSLVNGVNYNFKFDEEEVSIKETISGACGLNKIKYSFLKKVVVRDNYIYLYINKIQAYPVRKVDISNNDMEEIKRLLGSKIC